MQYFPTIGLEIHAEVATSTKMFCSCLNDPNETHPNFNICEVCTGQPGTLPVINEEAVRRVVLLGKALEGKVQRTSFFARKNYFYPDLPKGYQISQYEAPLVQGGKVSFSVRKSADQREYEARKVRLRRIHLEEDTGKLVHPDRRDVTLVDFNRAGVPLLEIVTEPEIHSGEEAKAFAEELILILRSLGVSEANPEKGQIRFEANISISEDRSGLDADRRGKSPQESASSPRESALLGTKVEIKNLNSLRALEGSINYEIERQKQLLAEGKKVVQETRGWDEVKGITFSQRQKEEAQDYRYFPEPDLPPLVLSEEFLSKIAVGELPFERRMRMQEEYHLSFDEVDVLVRQMRLADFFEEAVSEVRAWWEAATDKPENAVLVKLVYNYLTTDVLGVISDQGLTMNELQLKPEHLAHVIVKVAQKEISSRMAKDLLMKVIETGIDPETLMKNEGIEKMGGDEEIAAIIQRVIQEHKKAVEDYKEGKATAFEFLFGQAMRLTKGRIDPERGREMLREELGRTASIRG